jgi:hypothetical protein
MAALGAFERVQFESRFFRLDAKEPHPCSARGAARSLEEISDVVAMLEKWEATN